MVYVLRQTISSRLKDRILRPTKTIISVQICILQYSDNPEITSLIHRATALHEIMPKPRLMSR